jgi:hypothetical protein
MKAHPEITFAIKKAFTKLEQEKITPWTFLLSNKMPPIKDFHGRIIKYRGVTFEGSPTHFFWNGFIDPFLEELIIWAFKYALDHAKERNFDPDSCIDIAQQSLQSGISRIFARMQDIDRRLRGGGFPDKVPPHNIESIERSFLTKINEYKTSILQGCQNNIRTSISEVKKERRIEMKTNDWKAAYGWKEIEKEYEISKRAFGKKINFVKDAFKRKVIFRDIEQAYFLASNGFCKPAVILAGSVIEELLRLYLESKGIRLSDNTLNYYIKTCVDKRILKKEINKLADVFREFRNIVHLAKEESKRNTISRPTAKSAVASIFTIANDFEMST